LVTRNIILPLWNSFSFFSTYANADDITFEDLEKASPVEDRPMMDRWIISSMQSLIKTVNEKMENYYLYEVIPPLMNFVDELTNWYVRSNRKRFWKEKDENDIDKINAFKTLHEVLLEFSKSMAPVLPFICEKIYQGLIEENNESIHYCDYPEANENLIDKDLEDNIELAKKVIKSVRNLRVKLKLPNKQPLNSVKIITKDKEIEEKLNVISELIKNEVNVKEVLFDFDVDNWINYEFKPNFKVLGPKLGKQINVLSEYLKNVDENISNDILQGNGVVIDDIKVSSDEIDIILNKKEDNENQDIVDDFSLYLDTSLDENLIMERFSRELVSSIQKLRKDSGLDVVDRIKLTITSNDSFVKESLNIHDDYVKNETLAVELNYIEEETQDLIFDKNVSLNIKKLTNNS